MRKGKCASPNRNRNKHRVTLALNEALWDRFQPVLKEKWGDSFTSWLEYAMECYSRDTCRGCPYEPDEGQEKAVDGIGKVVDNGIE
jgi:hypothetical protein